MKNRIKSIIVLAIAALTTLGVTAQNSVPAPGGGGSGNGGNSAPAPGTGGSFNPAPSNPAPAPAPNPAPVWGNPGWNSWNGPIYVNTPLSSPTWQNSGAEAVLAVGYDAQGVWRTIPMHIAYTYNGITYNVTVLNAYNPWTQMWNYGLDDPAYSTYYYLRGNYYNYYVNLSTGTYYFNL